MAPPRCLLVHSYVRDGFFFPAGQATLDRTGHDPVELPLAHTQQTRGGRMAARLPEHLQGKGLQQPRHPGEPIPAQGTSTSAVVPSGRFTRGTLARMTVRYWQVSRCRHSRST